jgi:hypothetical protein
MTMKCIREGIRAVWWIIAEWLNDCWRVVSWKIDDLSSAVLWKLDEWLTPDREFNSADFDPEDHK